jgi:hypothetical protein
LQRTFTSRYFPVGAVAVSVFPQTVAEALATVIPVGSVSERAIPVRAAVLKPGLVIVNVNDDSRRGISNSTTRHYRSGVSLPTNNGKPRRVGKPKKESPHSTGLPFPNNSGDK